MHMHDIDRGFPRSNFETAVSQEWESQLTLDRGDVRWSFWFITMTVTFWWPGWGAMVYWIVTADVGMLSTRLVNFNFYPRPVLASGYCRCLRLSVCVSGRPSITKFVRTITHQPFKLGSPNLVQRCKRPLSRSLLFCGAIDLDLQGQI